MVSLAAFVSEAQRYGDPLLPPLRETVDDVRAAIDDPAQRVVVAEAGAWSDWRPDRILGAVRVRLALDDDDDDGGGEAGAAALVGHVGRLVVVPDAQGRGLGAALLAAIEDAARRAGAVRMQLFTGVESEGPIRLYQRAGYRVSDREGDLGRVDDRGVRLVVLAKPLA
ncbi:Acetyltransferase (GNAT) family protein [Quadrisphaera granulorum]|uniref:Acetyltransferase (GNAT) family protein n=1 Tax=Quadrisphaera granulorum TaxID=317664 RepID=A0A316A6H4_9ACTN|nr:acetyltransferase (GNAT) family protein [Quadrisphaera granulorum]SZE97105.1 Acetyltransferase (GNAT) family protein [Quadrisphaera granulorum]